MTVEEGTAFLCIGIGIALLCALIFVVWLQVDVWRLKRCSREMSKKLEMTRKP